MVLPAFLLREDANIKRSAAVTDDYGRPIDDSTDAVKCRFSPSQGELDKDENGEEVKVDGTFHFGNIVIDAKDEIEFNSERFRIIQVRTHKELSGAIHHHTVSVLKVAV